MEENLRNEMLRQLKELGDRKGMKSRFDKLFTYAEIYDMLNIKLKQF